MFDEQHRIAYKKIRQRLFQILGEVCVECGYCVDVRALHFHHVRDDGNKDRTFHNSAEGLYRFYVRNPDIAKSNLEVLCANCHEIKRYQSVSHSL